MGKRDILPVKAVNVAIYFALTIQIAFGTFLIV